MAVVSSIAIGTYVIPGFWETPRFGRQRLQVARTKYFGVAGESEIHGLGGGREIAIPFYFFDNFPSAAALLSRIDQLDYKAEEGLAGDLQLSGPIYNRTYHDVTFEGFEVDPEVGVLPDVAGTLDGGWFAKGTLHFYDLRIRQ